MHKCLVAILLGAALAWCATETRGEDPRVPAYLVLRAPERLPQGPAYYPGRGYAVTTQAYAYGWFGVKARSHWRRHEGYHAAYIQWSRQ